jgi:ribosomal 50S subunit-recycling heat shock protein
VRLDQYLKWSRVIARRTMAKATCDAGKVDVNQSVARPGKDLSVGDIVTVDLPHRVMKFRVVEIPNRAPGKSGARDLIEILENKRKDPDL